MWNFCLFEIKYRLKSITTYIFAIILIAISLYRTYEVYTSYLASPTPERAAPINCSLYFTSFMYSFVYLIPLMMVVIMYLMFYKTIHKKFYQILFSKPITKYQYVLGSSLGNVIVMFGAFLVAMVMWRLVLALPAFPAQLVMPDKVYIYLANFFISILPNIVVCGCFCVSAVLLTKRTSVIFVVAFAYAVLAYITMTFPIPAQLWQYLVDISGNGAMTSPFFIARSREMMLTGVPGLSFESLLNRGVWLCVSGGLLVLGLWRFDYDFTFRLHDRQRLLAVLNVFRKG